MDISLVRIGYGWDIHRLVKGRKLILGGEVIPHNKGLLGHSDADVLTHAICDALLGASGCGDIGEHFPDTDPRYKDIDSIKLLKRVVNIIEEKRYVIVNIDATIFAEKPNLIDFKKKIRRNIAEVLNIDLDNVNIKAKTSEGLGSIGKGEAIAACCAASIIKKELK